MKSKFFVLLGVSLCFACTANQRARIDACLFDTIGGTVFLNPQQVTAKELHLDTGILIGKPVVIEGKVSSIGKYQTHVVLQDETADILVVVTDIVANDGAIESRLNQNIRILGTMERGKRGLPFVVARGISKSKSRKKTT